MPLFVEELTKAVLESVAQGDRVAAVLGGAALTAQSVPATLHASLMARLDRLGPAPKEIAQIGAVSGASLPQTGQLSMRRTACPRSENYRSKTTIVPPRRRTRGREFYSDGPGDRSRPSLHNDGQPCRL